MKKLVLILTLLSSSALAQGQESVIQVSQPQAHLPGKDLMTMCSGLYDVDYGYCAGYLKAVADIMMDQTVYGLSACNHGTVKPQQLIELMQIKAQEDPALAMQPGSVIATQTLARSFACR